MTGLNFARAGVFAVALSVAQIAATGAEATQAPQAMKPFDTLTGQLKSLLSRDKLGKRINTFQLISVPRRLPAPSGLCNLTTGPETFQIVTTNEAQVALLHKHVGHDVSLTVSEVACASEKNQWSEAVVTKWSLVKR